MATATVTPNPTKTRKPRTAATPEQKRAKALRRDANMLKRLAEGSSDPSAMLAHAEELTAKANQLAPEAPKREPKAFCAYTSTNGAQCKARAAKDGQYCFSHTDATTKLTEAEWERVEGYFLQNLRSHLLEGFSWRQLKEIATSATN